MKTIKYKGISYRVRTITDNNGNILNISTQSLCDALEQDDFKDLAEEIDNAMVGYIPDDQINATTEDLQTIVREYGIIE